MEFEKASGNGEKNGEPSSAATATQAAVSKDKKPESNGKYILGLQIVLMLGNIWVDLVHR